MICVGEVGVRGWRWGRFLWVGMGRIFRLRFGLMWVAFWVDVFGATHDDVVFGVKTEGPARECAFMVIKNHRMSWHE